VARGASGPPNCLSLGLPSLDRGGRIAGTKLLSRSRPPGGFSH